VPSLFFAAPFRVLGVRCIRCSPEYFFRHNIQKIQSLPNILLKMEVRYGCNSQRGVWKGLPAHSLGSLTAPFSFVLTTEALSQCHSCEMSCVAGFYGKYWQRFSSYIPIIYAPYKQPSSVPQLRAVREKPM
jgi:hypothetical protein